jgi:superfamily II DNA or RNA helicase
MFKNLGLHQIRLLMIKLYQKHGWYAKAEEQSDSLLVFGKQSAAVPLFRFLVLSSSISISKEELVKKVNQTGYLQRTVPLLVLSENGFDEEAYEIEDFGLVLIDDEYIQELENSAESILLLPHNLFSFNRIMREFNRCNMASVEHSTGSGKSFLAAKVVDKFNTATIILAPSNFILDIHRTLNKNNQSIFYFTYAKAAQMSADDWNEYDVRLIVLDEYHRGGAEYWGSGIETLKQCFPNAYYFGTTATSLRHLDGNRDMAEELFRSAPVTRLTLADAIVRNILPMPTYITALYDIDEEVERSKKTLLEQNSNIKYRADIENQYMALSVEWQQTHGIESILRSHKGNLIGKYIVFFENKEHLESNKETVCQWFKRSNSDLKIDTFTVSSHATGNQNRVILDQFETNPVHKNISLLFSINMVNEGVHVKGISAAILLRRTRSKNVYFQQIGRCFDTSNKGERPIIFDLVNNIKNSDTETFKAALNQSLERIEEQNTKNRLINREDNKDVYTGLITDKAIDLVGTLRSLESTYFIRQRVKNICGCIDRYNAKHGNVNIRGKKIIFEGQNLAKKALWLRGLAKDNALTEPEMDLIQSTGFNLHVKGGMPISQVIQFLKEGYEVHGQEFLSFDLVTPDESSLKAKLIKLDEQYYKKQLTDQQVSDLYNIGIDLKGRNKIGVKRGKILRKSSKRMTQEELLEGLRYFNRFHYEFGYGPFEDSSEAKPPFDMEKWAKEFVKRKRKSELEAKDSIRLLETKMERQYEYKAVAVKKFVELEDAWPSRDKKDKDNRPVGLWAYKLKIFLNQNKFSDKFKSRLSEIFKSNYDLITKPVESRSIERFVTDGIKLHLRFKGRYGHSHYKAEESELANNCIKWSKIVRAKIREENLSFKEPIMLALHEAGFQLKASDAVDEYQLLIIIKHINGSKWYPKFYEKNAHGQNVGQWLFGLNKKTLSDNNQALLERINQLPRELQGKEVTVNGKTYPSISVCAKEYGLKRRQVQSRLNKGWSIERAVTTPLASANIEKKRI